MGDPIRLNRDIINISGATISVHSVNAAVRKTLALLERHYREPRRPTPDALRPAVPRPTPDAPRPTPDARLPLSEVP